MTFGDAKSIERMFTIIDQLKQDAEDGIKSVETGTPYGFETIDDQQFRLWFEQQLGKYPPTMVTDPQGVVAMVSPWVAMLEAKTQDGKPAVINGMELLRRYERIVGI